MDGVRDPRPQTNFPISLLSINGCLFKTTLLNNLVCHTYLIVYLIFN
jgi:hypothetical protein